jgi:hypothetical protein
MKRIQTLSLTLVALTVFIGLGLAQQKVEEKEWGQRAGNQVGVTAPAIVPPPCLSPPDGLVEWWPLDEALGTSVSNLISPHPHPESHQGSANPAAIGAGGPAPVTGMVDGALEFDGSSTYIEVPDSSGTLSFGNPTDNFSIDAWIKVASQNKSGVRPIVDKRVQIGARVSGYSLFLVDGRLGFQLADGAAESSFCDPGPPTATSSCTNYVSNVDVADGNWHLLAVTVQRTRAAQIALYVDGSLKFKGVARTGNANNNASLLIGRGYPIVISTPHFKGAIDELEIFSRALTQSEINAIFAAGPAGKCKPVEPQCCEFELRLFNALPNTINRIKIVPLDPSKIVHIRHEDEQEELEDDPLDPDPTEYKLQQVGSSYEITHVSGFIPFDPDEMIDEEFIVRVNSSTSLTAQWIDANGHILQVDEIALNCDALRGTPDDFQWQDKTKTITRAQPDVVLFAGAEREECDPDGAVLFKASSLCFTFNITNCNLLQLNAQGNFSSNAQYLWKIQDSDENIIATLTGKNPTFTLPGSGNQSIIVTLEVKDTDGTPANNLITVCSSNEQIDYCIPPSDDVDFDSSAPEAICVGIQITGYKVTFTPRASTCNVASFIWDFGDGSALVNGTGNPQVITHPFSNQSPATYPVKLELHYENGCVQLKTKTVGVDAVCKPKFKVEYSMCTDALNQNILVTCNRQSNKFCEPNPYKWDFGFGSSPNQSSVVTNLYTGVNPGTQVNITHTMIDNPICPGVGISTQCDFLLTPIVSNLFVKSCDDGKVNFSTDCPYSVRWSGIAGVDKITAKSFDLKLSNGSYAISCECYNEQGCGGDNTVSASCLNRALVSVRRDFCEIKEKHRANRQIGDDLYRMKYKFKAKFENASRLFDRALVVSRTKLKVKRCVKVFGKTICYRRGFKADMITAGFEGTLRGNKKGTSGCRGDESTKMMNVDETDPKSNKKKDKVRSTRTYLVHKADPVKSVHEVIIGGTVWRIELQKPKDTCFVQ